MSNRLKNFKDNTYILVGVEVFGIAAVFEKVADEVVLDLRLKVQQFVV